MGFCAHLPVQLDKISMPVLNVMLLSSLLSGISIKECRTEPRLTSSDRAMLSASFEQYEILVKLFLVELGGLKHAEMACFQAGYY